jgi:FtsP/CotA-like multicopper oxidase with cupredoxin domain/cytochrome c biogenesis protein CcdA
MTDNKESVPSTTQAAQPAPSETKAEPSTKAPVTESKARSWLIFGAIGLFAAIVFGVLYLFVLAPTIPDGNIGWFLFSFATGLTMIVMPCTLPLAFVIVPLSMGRGMIKGLGMALAFGLGIAVTLSLYGVLAAVLGGIAIDALGSDLESIKNWVYFVAGIFAFLFALGELGLINIHMPTYSGAAPAAIQKRQDVIKAFMLGLFLGNVGVGCPHPATPLILIEIASSGDILYGWLMFLVHAVGRVLPLLLLAFMAILGVNGLNWLLTRKAAVERVTGWAMVFVAGFILTLGLFSHDWWVNSGIHGALEVITQESRVTGIVNDTLGTAVAHAHGFEIGEGLFGLPLEWGSWFLVALWIIPIWWWYWRKRQNMMNSPAFALKRIEYQMDALENDRAQIEATANIDGLDPMTDLVEIKSQIAALKIKRRSAAKAVEYGETGVYKTEAARSYEVKILGMRRNFFILLTILLALVFIYFMPANFLLKSQSGSDDHGAAQSTIGIHAMADGTIMNGAGEVVAGAHVMADGTIMLADGTMPGMNNANVPESATLYSTDTRGLPDAVDPETVELEDGDSYDITAGYVKKDVGNRTLRMLAYNRSVPGPFIKAPQGAEVTINFTNNTDLDQTIHSHGLRLDNLSDGVPGVTQNAVKPGGSHTYTIKFEDAGVFWYHPHTRDDYGQEMGLYGNYLVDPESGYASEVNREIPLVIDDILIENDRIVDFYKEITNFALLGRFGNEYLVNGEKNYTLTAQKGEVMRFYVTNVSNARTYNLSLLGAKMKLVGADVGQYEREEFADDFLISPAERMIVEAYFEKKGVYSLMHTTPEGSVELTRVVVTDDEVSTSYADQFNTLNTNDEVVAEFADFRNYINSEPDKRLLLTVALEGEVDHSAHTGHATDDASHNDGDGDGDGDVHAHDDAPAPPAVTMDRIDTIQWNDAGGSDRVNTTENVTWKMIDQDTDLESMMIPVSDWTFTEGDLVKVRLTNDADADHVMQHPIHLHGQQFVVLSENGVPNTNMAWKDTVLVFPGETVDILVDMSNLGEWMSHCHISEHLHAGMMMQFRVQDAEGNATGDEFRKTVPPSEHSQMQMSDEILTPDPSKYSYADEVTDTEFRVLSSISSTAAGREELLTLTFTDNDGISYLLDEVIDRAVTVIFVKSDDSRSFVTYPGNTNLEKADHGERGHDDSDGHHGTDPETAPGHDDSDGHHGFNFVNVALAHGGIDDGHEANKTGREYSVPVVFPASGEYRGFVEFTLKGETEPRVGVINVEVFSSSFSIDNYNWSEKMQWWILFIVSLILMIPLVLGVRKYINVEKV